MSFLFLSTLVVVLAGLYVDSEPIVTFNIVEVESFEVGMSATAVYTAPGDGRSVVHLLDADGGVVLTMSHRFDWGKKPDIDILTLNTKPAGGRWGTREVVKDFYYTPGANMELTAKAEDDHFAIIANGLQVATYNYRLPVETVKRIKFFTSKSSGSELVSFTIEY